MNNATALARRASHPARPTNVKRRPKGVFLLCTEFNDSTELSGAILNNATALARRASEASHPARPTNVKRRPKGVFLLCTEFNDSTELSGAILNNATALARRASLRMRRVYLQQVRVERSETTEPPAATARRARRSRVILYDPSIFILRVFQDIRGSKENRITVKGIRFFFVCMCFPKSQGSGANGPALLVVEIL